MLKVEGSNPGGGIFFWVNLQKYDRARKRMRTQPRFSDRSDHEVDACYHSWEDRDAINGTTIYNFRWSFVSPSLAEVEVEDKKTEKKKML